MIVMNLSLYITQPEENRGVTKGGCHQTHCYPCLYNDQSYMGIQHCKDGCANTY